MPVVFGEGAVAAMWAMALVALLSWMLFFSLHWTWMRTFGFLFYKLGDLLRIDVTFVHWHPGNSVKALSDDVANSLLAASRKSENAAGALFHGAASIQAWIGHELAGLATDVYRELLALRHGHIPKLTKLLVAPVVALILPALIARWLAKNIGHYVHASVRVIERTLPGKTITIVKQIGAVAIPGAIAIPKLRRDVGSLWKWRKAAERRIGQLEKVVGATGGVALFTAAVARLGLRWLRCRNVTKAGRRLCGMDGSLLEELLTDGLLIVGTVSVVEFARELRAIEDEAVVVMRHMIREFPG